MYIHPEDQQVDWVKVREAAWCLALAFLMLFLFLGCATPAPKMPAAVPEHVVASFDEPGTEGKLFSEPCLNLTIMEWLKDQVPLDVLAGVKAANGTYDGQPYGACWFWNLDESAAVVVWDDLGYFAVPRRLLKFPVGV